MLDALLLEEYPLLRRPGRGEDLGTDVLRRLGDLTEAECEQRVAEERRREVFAGFSQIAGAAPIAVSTSPRIRRAEPSGSSGRRATLPGSGVETKINAYVELASLKLDSEWAVSLAGNNNADVPPVSLVFTGALNKAAEISPAVDTAAIEAYLTMRRMQEGVEQLETLDVSGRTPSSLEAAPDDQTSAVPAEPPSEPEATGEAAAPEPPLVPEAPALAVPQSAPSAASVPSAIEVRSSETRLETSSGGSM